MDRNEQKVACSIDPDINPANIRPKIFLFRLRKIMNEYFGSQTVRFTTSK